MIIELDTRHVAGTNDTQAGATFSACGRYRYHLFRAWPPELLAESRGSVLWVLLNPSTADEYRLDPTLTRCRNFARAWGYTQLDVCNIFALRSTNPAALYTERDPVGPANDAIIALTAKSAQLVVVGWGTHGKLHERGVAVLDLLLRAGVTPLSLGSNRDGSPRHPLYLSNTARPQPLDWPRIVDGARK